MTGSQSIPEDRGVASEATPQDFPAELLEMAMQAADIGVWEWNLPKAVLTASGNAAAILESIHPGLIIPLSDLQESIHPRDIPALKSIRDGYLRGERAALEAEYRLRSRGGEWKWVRTIGKSVEWDDQGRPARIVGVIWDITERKQAEEDLRKSEARLRKYFEMPLVGALMGSLEMGWVEYNDKFLEILGYNREDQTHLEFSRMTPPEVLSSDIKEYTQLLMGEIDGYSTEKRFIRKSGEIVNAKVAIQGVRRADGNLDFIVAHLEDVTERRRAEEEARIHQCYLEALTQIQRMLIEIPLNGLPLQEILEVLGRVSGVNRVVFYKSEVDPAGEVLLNLAAAWASEGTPQPNMDTLQKLPAKSISPRGLACLQRGEPYFGSVSTFEEFESPFAVALNIKSFLALPLIVHGQFYGYIGFSQLDSERKWASSERTLLASAAAAISMALERRIAEESLRAREMQQREFAARLSALHQVSLDLSEINSLDDLLRSAIEMGREHLGFDRLGIWLYSEEDLVFHGSFGVDELGNVRDERGMETRPEGMQSEPWKRVLEEKISIEIWPETELKDHAGKVVGKGWNLFAPIWNGPRLVGALFSDNLLSQRPLAAEEPQFLVLFARLIGHLIRKIRSDQERTRLEAQMWQAQKLEALGVLTGGIAHDFNNLLTAILGNASLALTEISPSSPVSDQIRQVEASAHNAADLVRQMLAFSGHAHSQLEPLTLSDLVLDMKHLLQVSATKRCELNCDLAPNLPAIEGDEAQIRQVLLNLVTNAAEACGEKPGVITIRTTMRTESLAELACEGFEGVERLFARPHVCLEVSDTGCGMTEEIRSRVFEPFFSTKFAGRGLGLAAVLGIVRGHHGAIRVRTELGQGTCFSLLFPSTVSHPSSALSAKDPRLEGKGTVLVVDDEEVIRELGKRILEKAGYQVLLAADGLEAVQVYRREGENIHVILLDMTMPRMDGEEAATQIRKIRPDAKIILSSGYDVQEESVRLGRYHLSGYIQKPYRMEVLLETIQNALADSTRD